MRGRRMGRNGLIGALGLVALALAWIGFGPAVLGGGATYLIVSGTSMLPSFHAGDLVVVRNATDYEPGDIVAYRNRQLGVMVLHRIVRLEAGRYVFKGDNNTWEDEYHPVPADLVGRVWVHAPGAGRYLGNLRSPQHLALLTGLAVVTMMAGDQAKKAQRRRRRRWRGHAGGGAGNVWLGHGARPGLAASAVLASLFLLMGVWAWRTPVSREAPTSVGYTQHGAFVYRGEGQSGTVYPAGLARTGDPLYLNLMKTITVTFLYTFSSAGPHSVQGTAALDAVLRGSDGWVHEFSLQAPQPFRGDRAMASGSLRLADVAGMIAQVQDETGLRNETFTLSFVPRVSIGGLLSGAPFGEVFSPPLSFKYDPVEMSLAGDADTVAKALEPSVAGSLQAMRAAPRTIGVSALRLQVATARRASLTGFVLALLATAGFGWMLRNEGMVAEADRIRARFGGIIVDARDLALDGRGRVVWVANFASLVRLATQYERLILHQDGEGGEDYYLVQDTDCVYCYRADPRPGVRPVTPAVPDGGVSRA